MNNLRKSITYLKLSVRYILRKPGPSSVISVLRNFPAWLSSFSKEGHEFDKPVPWLTFGAIRAIYPALHKKMKVFEYGSGGSTLYWAPRVESVISVEHNKQWHARVQQELNDRGAQNVRYFLVSETVDPEFAKKDFKNPAHYISGDPEYNATSFENYVKTIDQFPDLSFDLIIVDGRARPSCISHSISKLRKGGLLVVDNSERDYYLDNIDFKAGDWKRTDYPGPVPFSYHFSQTTIFHKLSS